MYPFYVMGLPHEVTDQQVEARYIELLRRYPPDRAAEEFTALRKAYEALRDEPSRRKTRLFYLESLDTQLSSPLLGLDTAGKRRRLTEEQMTALLCLEHNA